MSRAQRTRLRRQWPDRFRRALGQLLVGMYYQAPVFDIEVARALTDWFAQPADCPPEPAEHRTAGDSRHRLPPPGHPETLIRGIPLSPCERELWADVLGKRPGRRQVFRSRWFAFLRAKHDERRIEFH